MVVWGGSADEMRTTWTMYSLNFIGRVEKIHPDLGIVVWQAHHGPALSPKTLFRSGPAERTGNSEVCPVESKAYM